ncbi:MAG: Tad domain-containing protein [Kiritimatiellae bacterium]|nr:Tad domain-containing protein [Kiritimatiellia bacterium]
MVRRGNSGQAIVFILMALVILAFLLLFQVDLHRIIQRKGQTRNAGDSAVLAAARWQGATLNLIGDLNLVHALALAAGSEEAAAAATNIQIRLAFTGPLAGLYAAQVLAKNNGMRVDAGMSQILRDHAATIRNLYAASNEDGEMYFPEPWPGAWNEYSDLLRLIADSGIAAGPDNMQTYTDPGAGHLLLTKDFYYAVMGHGWCWFKFHAPALLSSYNSFHDWPPLPDADRNDYWNAEVFPLHVHPSVRRMRMLFSPDELAGYAQDAGHADANATLLAATNLTERAEVWFFYNGTDWGEWKAIKPDGEDNFPITGPVREEYDTAGADAAIRVSAPVTRLTPNIADGGGERVLWTAAAKPFGYLDTQTGKDKVTSAAGFVLPAFRNVRLVPIDAVSNADASSSDVEWVTHVRSHLKQYVQNGPSGAGGGCRYCSALALWENDLFRREGADWLEEYGGTCRRPSHGPGHGGGSRRGH